MFDKASWKLEQKKSTYSVRIEVKIQKCLIQQTDARLDGVVVQVIQSRTVVHFFNTVLHLHHEHQNSQQHNKIVSHCCPNFFTKSRKQRPTWPWCKCKFSHSNLSCNCLVAPQCTQTGLTNRSCLRVNADTHRVSRLLRNLDNTLVPSLTRKHSRSVKKTRLRTQIEWANPNVQASRTRIKAHQRGKWHLHASVQTEASRRAEGPEIIFTILDMHLEGWPHPSSTRLDEPNLGITHATTVRKPPRPSHRGVLARTTVNTRPNRFFAFDHNSVSHCSHEQKASEPHRSALGKGAVDLQTREWGAVVVGSRANGSINGCVSLARPLMQLTQAHQWGIKENAGLLFCWSGSIQTFVCKLVHF